MCILVTLYGKKRPCLYIKVCFRGIHIVLPSIHKVYTFLLICKVYYIYLYLQFTNVTV